MLFPYKIEDLKKRFSELRRVDDIVLVPLMNIVLCDFIQDLQSDHRKYGITSFDVLHEYNRKNVFDDEYVVMMGMMVIKIKVYYADIYVVDGGGAWYMCSSVVFNSGGAGEFAQKLLDELKNFVKRQNLSELKKKASLELKKALPKHLISGIAEFYLR